MDGCKFAGSDSLADFFPPLFEPKPEWGEQNDGEAFLRLKFDESWRLLLRSLPGQCLSFPIQPCFSLPSPQFPLLAFQYTHPVCLLPHQVCFMARPSCPAFRTHGAFQILVLLPNSVCGYDLSFDFVNARQSIASAVLRTPHVGYRRRRNLKIAAL